MNKEKPLRKYDNRKATGKRAEQIAVRYLIDHGYTIVSSNWYCRTGELDIVAMDSSQLVIVEVRSKREGSMYGTALEAVTPSKINQVRKTAEYYLYQTGNSNANVRFDVIAVTMNKDGTYHVQHIQAAF